MCEGDAEVHAAEHEDRCCKRRKYEVNLEECHRHIAQARHDAIHRRARTLGVIHIDGTCAGLRQERDKDHDDTEAPNPRRHHAPEEEAVGEGAERGKDRCPRSRETGDAFKERVEKAEIIAEQVGEHTEKRPREPTERRDGDALARRQLLGRLSVAAEADADKCADEDGQRERLTGGLVACDCKNERDHKRRRHCK